MIVELIFAQPDWFTCFKKARFQGLNNGCNLHETTLFGVSFHSQLFSPQDCSQVVRLHERCLVKESVLPTLHSFVNVNTSPTARIGIRLRQMKSRCSLVFHLRGIYQSSMRVFIASPLSSCLDRILTTFYLSQGDLGKGGCWRTPPPTTTHVEIKGVTSLITKTSLFPLLLCIT